MVVGGNAASRPRIAEVLAEGLTTAQALQTTDNVLNHFKEHGKKGERLGRFMDRIGFAAFQQAVLP